MHGGGTEELPSIESLVYLEELRRDGCCEPKPVHLCLALVLGALAIDSAFYGQDSVMFLRIRFGVVNVQNFLPGWDKFSHR